MIARMHKTMEEKDRGFTLIELLVVIIIIGILAAIAIPAFLNQRQNAWASQVESDVRNAAIAAESYAVNNNGSYSGLPSETTASEWSDAGFNTTQDVTVTANVASDGNSFTLVGTHTSLDSGSRTFTYDSTTGVTTDSANP
ncbi:prepilin-type N-terminal cleavage/methylation domain-containing protein [Cellulomonas bogoriensis]|uniref:Secretion protein n=1 Tax=Cellulomonas bogoriensis 69B4 = DSM 16987 TaxID=1386082 RepID=A0A0A0C267_9CELL|nr:prepilin-type N-terminal cleavage/methylation domain-containing protein [Cellulomonas bogoriensis]KGM14261.1 secretion protein [Cellulomonas bogoriensis 69B4 = DSM 16987]